MSARSQPGSAHTDRLRPKRRAALDSACAAWLFGPFCAVVAAARYWMLSDRALPPGIDGGNWLAFGHALLGHSVRSTSIVYPPLVPLAVTAAVALLGATHGVALVAALASVGPGVGAYHALRRTGATVVSFLAAAFLVPATSTGEAAAWGGYPQLVGLGLTVVFAVWADRWLGSGRRRDGLVASALLLFDLLTSHFTSAVAFLALAVLLVLRVVDHRGDQSGDGTWPGKWSVVGRAAVVCLVALPLLPLYVHLAQAMLSSGSVSGPAGHGQLSALWGQLEHASPGFGPASLVVAVLSPLLLVRIGRRPLWNVAVAVLAAGVVLVLITGQARFEYVLPVGVALAVGCWIDALVGSNQAPVRRTGAVLAGAVAVAVFAACVLGPRDFRAQRGRYAVLDQPTYQAIRWLGTHTALGAGVVVPDVGGAPLGWWVEGLASRPTLTATSLDWVVFPDERRRASEAAFVLGQLPSPSTFVEARRFGAHYLLLPKRWEGYQAAQVDQVVATVPGAVVFANSGAVIIDIRRALAQG